jgi:hypothetical protein
MARSSGVFATAHSAGSLAVSLIVLGSSLTVGFAREGEGQARARRWPCLVVVKPTLDRVVDDGMEGSPTFRRQCEELAAARAVVAMEWGRTDSQSRAISKMDVKDGVVVAVVSIPPVADAIELVAHEFQHVIERTRALDFEAESKRPASGVWRAFGGYETQAAIDAGRQVAREVAEARRAPRPSALPPPR